MELNNLKKEIPHKWRVQSYSKNKPMAQCVAYIDARDVMDLLDEVVGAGNWQSDFKEIGGKIYGGIAILIEGQWVWKWDCGSESKMEAEKGQSSDAFKRAGVKWGIGRFLYEKPIKYLKANKTNTQGTPNHELWVINQQGERVWDITKFINEQK